MSRSIFLVVPLLALLLGCEPAGDPVVQLAHAVEQANAGDELPRRIDEQTEIVAIELGPTGKEVLYICRFTGHSHNDALAGQEDMQAATIAAAKRYTSGLAFFRKHKIPLTYVYRDEEATEVMRFTIEPWNLP